MTTDPPKPDDREELAEWMVGRIFKVQVANSQSSYFYVDGYTEEYTPAPEGVNLGGMDDVKTKSHYLECKMLKSEEIVVSLERGKAVIGELPSPDDITETEKAPLDSIRSMWKIESIREL